MANKDSKPGSPTGTKVEIEAPTDQWGNQVDQKRDRFPEGSAAREGSATLPSGQGGSTPHDGISYQDQFAPNPEPSETAKAWGQKVDEVGPVEAASQAIGEAAKQGGKDNKGPNEGTKTATSQTP
jgi:hypothetical protein